MSIASRGGSSFCATTTAAITNIHGMLITLSVTSSSISPMLDPTQYSPNTKPERMLSRQRARNRRLSGVSSYTPAATATTPATSAVCGR